MTYDLTPSFVTQIPPGDDRNRNQCTHCGFIDYVNPRIVAGALAVQDGKILLCRRAIEPRKGFWTLPAGYMEQGEDVEGGARREAREEAHAEIEIDGVLGIYSVPRISQVQILFRARLMNTPKAGPESEEVALFDWDDIPWSEIAFPTVHWALRAWKRFSAGEQSLPDIRTATERPDGI